MFGGGRGQFGVNRVAFAVGRLFPVYPDKQTFTVSASMSQKGQ